jgi:hypothetical protein
MTRLSGFDLHQIEVAVGLELGLPGSGVIPLTAAR